MGAMGDGIDRDGKSHGQISRSPEFLSGWNNDLTICALCSESFSVRVCQTVRLSDRHSWIPRLQKPKGSAYQRLWNKDQGLLTDETELQVLNTKKIEQGPQCENEFHIIF